MSDVSVEPLDEADTPEDAAAASAPVGRRLLRDNLSVAAGTALSRVTGVARILALGFAVKESLADAYLLANNTPNIIYELILGGVLTATLVPMFTGHLEDGDDDATNAVVSTTVVALVALTLVTAAAAPLLIAMYGTNTGEGVDPDVFRSVGIRLSLLFAPQVLGYGLMAVGSALLNSRKRFFAAAWAPVLNNVIVTAMFVVVGVLFGSRGVDYADGNTGLLLLLGLVQVIHVTGPESVDEATALAGEVDALLLDSGNPRLAVKELGGTGRVHDWSISRAIREAVDVPVYLAGGLNASNAAQAVRQVRPYALDICSGVRTDGRLDEVKLRGFISAATSV